VARQERRPAPQTAVRDPLRGVRAAAPCFGARERRADRARSSGDGRRPRGSHDTRRMDRRTAAARRVGSRSTGPKPGDRPLRQERRLGFAMRRVLGSSILPGIACAALLFAGVAAAQEVSGTLTANGKSAALKYAIAQEVDSTTENGYM